SNLTMVYMVAVVVSAMTFGRGPAIAAAVVSSLLFDYLFVHPRLTFLASDTQYLLTFAVELMVAILIGTLTASLRNQLRRTRQREQRTAALYHLSHDLVAPRATREVVRTAIARIAEVLDTRVTLLLPGDDGRLREPPDPPASGWPWSQPADVEVAAASWVHEHGAPAGSGTAVFPAAGAVYVALRGATGGLGVLAIRADDPRRLHDPEPLALLEALASQTSLALERCRLAGEAETAHMAAETERTRSALLSSVSHDMRTPLTAITGAASNLCDGSSVLADDTRRALTETISKEAERLNRLIGNLLDMTRLESGAVRARKEWHSVVEVVGAALGRLEAQLGDRPVRLALADHLSLVPLDDVLIEQVVCNLVENAHKHTPPGRPIEIAASIAGAELVLEVADRGAGLAPGEERRVFEKFYRGADSAGRPGFGLGLAVCRGMVAAHGGTIEVANRTEGGARFTVRLPIDGEPPAIEAEASDASLGVGQ
ncbi:MAG TPA: ATP-binding protein, partial [Candidatus Eisenbacteria bacterium]|nr:ATP-binding protein [Candidatus Eisenbacteria bacterium]